MISVSTASSIVSRTSRSKYIQQIEDYTGCERLTMLLDALEIAVAKSNDLEQAVFSLLSPTQANISVEFVPERRNDLGFTLERDATNQLTSLRLDLSAKIELLRKAIDAS